MTSAADLVLGAWRGEHLPADGGWQRMEPWRQDLYAVLALTGHAAVSAPESVTEAELLSREIEEALELVVLPANQDRMRHMLATNKPLEN